jgi:hypothetical protein
MNPHRRHQDGARASNAGLREGRCATLVVYEALGLLLADCSLTHARIKRS